MYTSLSSSLGVWIFLLAMSNNYNPQVRHPALTDDMAARAGLSVQCKFCQLRFAGQEEGFQVRT